MLSGLTSWACPQCIYHPFRAYEAVDHRPNLKFLWKCLIGIVSNCHHRLRGLSPKVSTEVLPFLGAHRGFPCIFLWKQPRGDYLVYKWNSSYVIEEQHIIFFWMSCLLPYRKTIEERFDRCAYCQNFLTSKCHISYTVEKECFITVDH